MRTQTLRHCYRLRTAPLAAFRLYEASLTAQWHVPGRRHLTNATKPDFVKDLMGVPKVEAKDGGWHPTLIHSSGEVKWTVIRLEPNGGEVPNHLHNHVWDYFIPLSGEAVIETESRQGVKEDFPMKPTSFLALGPGDVHRVRNKSETEEFVFLIAQAPRGKYDFEAVS